ncbi:ABC transporter substrate-binding protein [Noviherbaspirillum sedimenti]|nr:ABC transporter substrate-binding protein [Noviherbaspirillum sedimenti]
MKLQKSAKTFVVGLGLSVGLLAGASAETLKIGVIAALTGGAAPWGMAAAEGAKIAAAAANAKGGLDVGGKKYQVEVVAYDDQYKAADAVAAYNRLVRQDGAKYVIIMSSAGALALKQNIEDDKIIGLTSSYSAKAIDANSRYMFRLFSVSSDYLPAMIGWMKANYKERRVFMLNPNDETGWDQTQVSGRLFKQNGYEVIGQDLYERTVKDFQPIFTKIIAMKPEMIDLGGTPPATAGLMMRQAREMGYKGLFMKTGGAGPRDIVAGAGKEAAEGMVSVLYADPNNEGYKRLAAEYKKSLGQEPNEIIVAFYDATNVLLQAIQKAGDARDTTKVAAAFAKALPMKSAQGDLLALGGNTSAGAGQQIISTNYIGVIKNGQPVVVGKAK